MLQFIRHYLLAVQFFTRLPITGRLAQWVGYSPAMLRSSAAHFPGIGWLVGTVAALVFAAASLCLPDTDATPLVAAVLCTVATILLTGAFHEDGLADVADGIGGAFDRDRALEIMKDSRLGTYGVLALVLGVMAKLSLLALLGSLSLLLACIALFLAHVFSRMLPLLVISTMVHVGDTATSKSKPLAEQIRLSGLLVASIWCLMAFVITLYMFDDMDLIAPVMVGVCASVLALGWMWRMFARRLQGFTGDCLGATQQVCEVAFYLGLTLGVGLWPDLQGLAGAATPGI